MRPAAIAASLLLLAGACGEDTVEVTVRGRPALRALTRLRVEVADGVDRVADELVVPAAAALPLTFVVATTGRDAADVTIAIEGLDAAGRLAGLGAATVAPGADAAVAITLEPADFVVNREHIVGAQPLANDLYYGGRQLAAGPDGRFLVAWNGDRTGRARMFGPEARPRVNDATGTDREFDLPDTVDADGLTATAHAVDTYAILWETHEPGAVHGRLGIMTYRDDDGVARSINAQSVDFDAARTDRLPSVGGLAGGGFALTWLRTADRFQSSGEVRLKVVDALGYLPPAVDSVVVGVADPIAEDAPAVAGLVDGGLVVVWEVKQANGLNRIVARVFDGMTARTGQQEVEAAPPMASRSELPVVAALPDGGFVVAWARDVQDASSIQARWFDPDGTPRGPTVEVVRADRRQTPAVAAGAAGVAFAWAEGADDQRDVLIRHYRLDGTPRGDPLPLATTREGPQRSPSLAPLAGLGFIAAWTDGSLAPPDDSDAAVRARVVYVD